MSGNVNDLYADIEAEFDNFRLRVWNRFIPTTTFDLPVIYKWTKVKNRNYFILTKHALMKIVLSQKISHLRQVVKSLEIKHHHVIWLVLILIFEIMRMWNYSGISTT